VISSSGRTLSAFPAAIAGVIRSDLLVLAKLQHEMQRDGVRVVLDSSLKTRWSTA
jgi:hypothetical protein